MKNNTLDGERVETTSSVYSIQPLTLRSGYPTMSKSYICVCFVLPECCAALPTGETVCCVLLRATACEIGPLRPARRVQPCAASLVSQRLHHRAAAWGRNYRRITRCERSFIYRCSSSGIRSDGTTGLSAGLCSAFGKMQVANLPLLRPHTPRPSVQETR